MTYIISYDLRKVKDYNGLYAAIKSYENCRKILESLWGICTTKSAPDIRDHLSDYMDKDDGLFVIKSGGAAAWKKILCSNQWLKSNL